MIMRLEDRLLRPTSHHRTGYSRTALPGDVPAPGFKTFSRSPRRPPRLEIAYNPGVVRSRKITSRRWSVAAPSEQAAELAQRLKTSPLVAQVLLNRGIDDPTAGLAFLRPNLRLLHDPAQIPGLADAAQRVARAIRDREAIVIYGDYDVDGITAVAILWHAIRLLGGNVRYYIPTASTKDTA